jgi:hypothetical protein
VTDPLFDLKPATTRKERGGPVYQGTCKQIRRLTAGDDALIDAELWAGTIAQARSLAASIDRVDGRDGGAQANGVPLSQMHMQLDALMARLNPEADAPDALTALMARFDEEERIQRDRAAPAPHPQV